MAYNINRIPICDSCGRVVVEVNGHSLRKVYLGDNAHSIEDWCWNCYTIAFPELYQRELQASYVLQVQRWGVVQ